MPPSQLSEAAAQYFDAATWTTLAAALVISTAAFVVMRLYMGGILRESQRTALAPQFDLGVQSEAQVRSLPDAGRLEIIREGPDGFADRSAPQSSVFRQANSAFRRAAGVYALGGSVHAATCVALLFMFGVYPSPTASSWLTYLACYAGVFWAWSSFTFFALGVFWGPHRRLHGLLILGYLALLPTLGALLELAHAPPLPFAHVGLMPEDQAALMLAFASTVLEQEITAEAVKFSPQLQPIVFWSLAAAPVTVPLIAFNRFVRGTVGPLFINLALIMVLSAFTLMDFVLYTPPGMWFARYVKGLAGTYTHEVLMAITFTLSGVLAWRGLLLVAGRYRHGRISDQTFLFDALWLSASFLVAVYLMPQASPFGYLLGFLPFALYKLATKFGLKWVVGTRGLSNARLLFLRVFASPRRSERLFDLLASRWRYAGSIQLISATDVARSRFEPDEFLDFLSGRLSDTYISSGVDLDRRLAGLASERDPDGRYRINEFFCRMDTWQPTVIALMAQTDLVAMDLRGFTSERKGCIFEIGALIDNVHLQRVVLLVDRTTDEPLLRQTLTELWRNRAPHSPNADITARVRVLDLSLGYSAAVRRLMQLGDEVVGAVWRPPGRRAGTTPV